MAFATTNINHVTIGDLKGLRGQWTGSVGDASGTISVGGSQLYLAEFWARDSVTGEIAKVPVTASTDSTTGLTTLTIHNHDTVADGTFLVAYK